jgi:hypothetical protein
MVHVYGGHWASMGSDFILPPADQNKNAKTNTNQGSNKEILYCSRIVRAFRWCNSC